MSASLRAKSGRPPQAGGAPLAYPPPSLERGVAGACLAGGAGEAAWHDKLALLLYLLMDADIADLEAFRCWPEMCGVCKGILCRRGPCLPADAGIGGPGGPLGKTCDGWDCAGVQVLVGISRREGFADVSHLDAFLD